MPQSLETVGVYIHVPFCERVCPYCDFAVLATRHLEEQAEQRYVQALLCELELAAAAFEGRGLASIYLGGGTPSLLTPDSVAQLLEAVRDRFGPCAGSPSPEVTLEVNPSTVERERLPGFRSAGVSRLSLGTQSFDDEVLRRLGRAHRAKENHLSFRAAREAGFENVSLDLIFGAPGGSPEQLERDLDAIVALSPEHVSTYQLTVEPKTPFATAHERGQLELPDADDAARLIERIETKLAEVGLARYEVSNHAHPGFESRHNQRYWQREPVLGLGVGAVTSEPASPGAPHGKRRANTRELSFYLDRVQAGALPVAESETLGARTARGEAVFLGLRRTAGLSATAFAQDFGHVPRHWFAEEIDLLLDAGLIREAPAGDLVLTPSGFLLADEVATHFV